MNLTVAARKLFCNDRYASELTGVEIVEAGPAYALCRVTVTELHLNAMGGVMGGVMFTLADMAFAVAANSETLEAGTLHWVSMDSHVVFLSNTRNDTITATARCVRQGRNACVYTITLSDGDGKQLALVTTTGLKR